MSAIRLNGQYVLLKDVEKKDFAAFVNLCMPKIVPDRPIPRTAADSLAALLAEGKTQSDPVVQAGFQVCASLGIKNMWLDGASASVTEEVPTDAAAGTEAAFGFAAIQSGLAFGAAMCNAFRRKIRINEQALDVVRQPRETMAKISQQVQQMKTVNEPVFITAGRLLGAQLKEGRRFDDPEVMTVLCMLSDLGATAVVVDLEKSALGFAAFDPANAMASAILQGLDAEKVANVRQSIQKVNEQLRRGAAERQAAEQGGRAQQRIAVPSVMGTRRRR